MAMTAEHMAMTAEHMAMTAEHQNHQTKTYSTATPNTTSHMD
jgi:hypothetical protein